MYMKRRTQLLSSNAFSCFTILKINNEIKRRRKFPSTWHTTLRIRDNFLCASAILIACHSVCLCECICVCVACMPAVLFFSRYPSITLHVRLRRTCKSFVCLLFSNICCVALSYKLLGKCLCR